MTKPEEIENEVQLLVEGKDQQNFFKELVDHLSLNNDVQIQNFGGVDELRNFLTGFIMMPDFSSTVRSIGIVRDAEKCAAGAFRRVRDSLENACLPVPNLPEERASNGGRLEVSVLILPGGNREGMLETLLCETFAGTREDGCIDAFFECVEASHGHLKRPDKSRAHAYLAMKPDPHVSVGVAASKGYWDLDHDVFGNVRDFLTSLSPTEP